MKSAYIALFLVVSLIASSSLVVSRRIFDDHHGFSNTDFPSMFDNNTTMWKWQNIFKYAHKNNNTEVQEKWNKWKGDLQEKFNQTSEKFKSRWKNATNYFNMDKKNHSFFGSFFHENGYVAGNFVRFISDNGSIVDYTVVRDENVTIFDFIHIDCMGSNNKETSHGAVWRLVGKNATIEVHDNPLALLKIKVISNCNVNMTLSNNLEFNKTNNSRMLSISGSSINGWLTISGNGSFSNVSEDYASISINKNSMVIFAVSPYPNVTVNIKNQERREKGIMEKIAEGKVCGRAFIEPQNKSDVVSYDNNTILNCTSLPNIVNIHVLSSGEEKILILDIKNNVFNSSNISVNCDGKTLPREINYNQIMNETGNISKYFITNGTNGVEIIIYIPHFSSHDIKIYSTTEEQPGISTSTGGTPGFEYYGVIMAILIALFISKRRNR